MKKLLNVFLVLCISIGAIGATFGLKPSETPKESSSSTDNAYEKVEIIEDVPNNYAFEIDNNKHINESNLNSYVKVTDVEGNKIPLSIKNKGDRYSIAPKKPYENGKSYNVELNNTNFKDEKYDSNLTFTVKAPTVENVSYASSVKYVDQNELNRVDVEGKSLSLNTNSSTEYNIGDVLIIPTLMPGTDYYVDVAYKIEDINGSEIDFSTPEMEEVYSDFEINNTYTAEGVTPYSEAEIEAQILENPEIEAISKALYDMTNNTEPDRFVTYNSKLVPQKIDIEFKSFDPLDVSAKVVWKLSSDVKLTVSLRYEKTTKVSFYADDNEKRQVTTESGKWTISADINWDIVNPDVQKLFANIRYRNKYIISLKDSYEADKVLRDIASKRKNPNLSPEEKDMLDLKWQVAQTAVDYTNLDKKFLQMENKKAAMLELKTLADYYRTRMKESGSVIKFVQLFFPVAPGVAFTTDVGAVLDFSISAAFTGKIVINSIQEVGTVSTKNSQEDFYNAYHQVSGFFGLCGKIEFKIGAQIGIGVTIAGVFNLKLTLEGGLYFEFSALGAIYFGDSKDLGLTEDENDLMGEAAITDNLSVVGTINYDVGSYYLLNFKVSLDLWVIEVSKTFEIVGDKISFIKNDEPKDEVFRELVFEDQTNLESLEAVINSVDEICQLGSSYDPTPVFELPSGVATVAIPNVYIRTIDLKTGKVTYELVNPEQLSFINDDKVFFNGLTCFARDYYEIEIDNRINIRLEDNDSGELVLPIRIIRQPISVNSISLSMDDNTNTIGLTEKKLLKTEILPYDASYTNFVYSINKIEKTNHSYYSGDFAQYAYIDNNYLYTTDKISIGSKIYITATAIKDNVQSSELIIEVNRVDIERIQLKDEFFRSDINLGEKLLLELSVFPYNATFNILHDEFLQVSVTGNSQCASLEKIDDFHYSLTAIDNTANVGKVISIDVTIGDISRTFTYKIASIPIESIILYDVDSQTELSNDIALTRGSTLKVSAVINPVNASVKNVNYNLFANIPNFGRYVTIDDDGLLTISDNAPYGMEIYLSATAFRKSTESYKITVEQIPVESVRLTADNSYIVKNTIMYLKAYVYPGDADINSTVYKIVNNAPGVFVSGNMIFASAGAIADSDVEVMAIVNGIESNILKIRIINDNSEEIVPSEDESSEPSEFEHISSDNRQVEGKEPEVVLDAIDNKMD